MDTTLTGMRVASINSPLLFRNIGSGEIVEMLFSNPVPSPFLKTLENEVSNEFALEPP